MAAPTSVSAESIAPDTVILYWAYGGSASISIYQSTDGVTYSFVTNVDSVLTYTITGLTAGTLYKYKLSDDGGSTFSSVVTVVTQSCGSVGGVANGLQLQQTNPNGDGPTASDFNQLSQEIEDYLRQNVDNPNACLVCSSNGALVFDCSKGCKDFQAILSSEDINSISFINCDDAGRISLVIPPSVTRKICGFPAGSGFGGNECQNASISGGTAGRTVVIDYGCTKNNPTGDLIYSGVDCHFDPNSLNTKPGTGGFPQGGGGGAGGSGTCSCVPGAQGQLTIKSCTANNSLSCSSSKSLTLRACGGIGPYTWSHTGSVKLQVGTSGTKGDTAAGSSVIVTPPTNSGSGVAGTAYILAVKATGSSAGFCSTNAVGQSFGCDDVAIGSCNTSLDAIFPITCSGGNLTSLTQLSCFSGSCCTFVCTGSVPCPKIGCNSCSCAQFLAGAAFTCDQRTGTMISNGCQPCGVQSGATVTVTDSTGTSVSITLRA